MTMHITLFATLNRPQAVAIVQRTAAWLLAQGHTVRMQPALAETSGFAHCRCDDATLMSGADLAISIGGDGTMLGAVRIAAPERVPVLGVNAGALGFLTELTPDALPDYLPRIVTGAYQLESRMMLYAKILRGETLLGESVALNDMVIRQGAQGRLINLDVTVAGHRLGRFGADGLIFSTPTGSTAYGLSAGGPIVHPATSVMLLVPICPHSLSFRPLVVPATDPVEICCEGNSHGDEMMVSADGQEPFVVQVGDRVIVHPAPEPAQLVKFGLFSFYDRLREKLQWGGGTP
ncbi:MAG TPA: NAD(+)/NADH kinase [Armatimonadota bacterium]|jgi:NAD+ kinase